MKLRYIALVLVVLVALSGCTGNTGKTPSDGSSAPTGTVTDAELTATDTNMANLDSLLADMTAADNISVDSVSTVI